MSRHDREGDPLRAAGGSRSCRRASTPGIAAVLLDPRSRFSRGMKEIVDALVGAHDARPARERRPADSGDEPVSSLNDRLARGTDDQAAETAAALGELAKRLDDGNGDGTRRAAADALAGRPARRAEGPDPAGLHLQARDGALHDRLVAGARDARQGRGRRGARPRPDAAQPRRARARRAGDRRRHPRLRPARAVPAGRDRHRDHGQRRRRTCTSSATASSSGRTSASPTTRTCSGSSTGSSRRSAGASTRPRRWSTRGSRTGAA